MPQVVGRELAFDAVDQLQFRQRHDAGVGDDAQAPLAGVPMLPGESFTGKLFVADQTLDSIFLLEDLNDDDDCNDDNDEVCDDDTELAGLCEAGPLVLVCPDGVYYRNLDEAAARRVVYEHLAGDEPVRPANAGNEAIRLVTLAQKHGVVPASVRDSLTTG